MIGFHFHNSSDIFAGLLLVSISLHGSSVQELTKSNCHSSVEGSLMIEMTEHLSLTIAIIHHVDAAVFCDLYLFD